MGVAMGSMTLSVVEVVQGKHPGMGACMSFPALSVDGVVHGLDLSWFAIFPFHARQLFEGVQEME